MHDHANGHKQMDKNIKIKQRSDVVYKREEYDLSDNWSSNMEGPYPRSPPEFPTS